MAVEYKYECYWSQQDGWHFSFGNKRLWEVKAGFRVAEVTDDFSFIDGETFTDLNEALTNMRLR